MTDDIVTRLREQYFTCECFGLGSGDCSRCETDKEAADEIERLIGVLTLCSVMAISHPQSIAFRIGQDAVIEWAKDNNVLLDEGVM